MNCSVDIDWSAFVHDLIEFSASQCCPDDSGYGTADQDWASADSPDAYDRPICQHGGGGQGDPLAVGLWFQSQWPERASTIMIVTVMMAIGSTETCSCGAGC